MDLAGLERAAWRADDPRLAPTGELARARSILSGFEHEDPAQLELCARIQAFIEEHPADAHRRSLSAGHLTASALVVDRSRGAALLTHHRKLDRWLQVGGHCDGDANLVGVALREASEESGIAGLAIHPRPIDVDIHAIPARPGEPEHLHLDTRFLVFAPPGARERASAESIRLAWFLPGELGPLACDDSVLRLMRRVLAH